MEDHPPINWRLVLDAIPDAITVHSSSGEILFANPKIAEYYGSNPQDLVGKKCESFFHFDSVPCPHEIVVAEGKVMALEARSNVDQGMYTILLLPFAGAEEEGSGYVRVMRGPVEGKFSAEPKLSQLISVAAHKIGTPLNIISGYSEYLLMKMAPDEQGHKEVSTILQQTRRIAEVIKQMLEAARAIRAGSDKVDLK